MLLTDWLAELNLNPAHRGVEYFGFGEQGYYIHMANGANHFDNDLERLLSVLEDEMRGAPNMRLVLTYENPWSSVSARHGISKRGGLELIVRTAWRSSPVVIPGITLQEQLDKIRSEVTMFNLSGQWARPSLKENL